MPEYYADWWWEELPPRAQTAAKAMGYTASTWDEDEDIPYDSKSFAELTVQEKHAAMFLGLNPIEERLDIWWDEVDSDTQKYAIALGWDKSKWDDEWEIQDLPCEHLYWKELTEEQKTAARYFGYSRAIWDETDEDDDAEFEAEAGSTPSPKKQSKPHHGSSEDEAPPESAPEASGPGKKTNGNKTKEKVIISKSFGGSGGGDFDHMNNKKITQITVWADRHVVNAIEVKYVGSTKKAGENTSGDEQVLTLEKDEYIDHVTVRANQFVQCITFKTNKGNTLGPCGGKGWKLIGKDHEGKEEELQAPKGGYMLCGIMGGAGACLDRIAFRWAPIPDSMKN